MRPTRDELGIALATAWSRMSTCGRRHVGCVLVDAAGHQLASGYNGAAAGTIHCTEVPCPGRDLPSGTGLEKCEAIHAEQNALIRCPDSTRIHTAYVTTSPCLHCVKMLMNTACLRIVFSERYAHDEEAAELWERGHGRVWVHHGSTHLD